MISQEKAQFVRLMADKDGLIEPLAVIEAARPADSPIHGEFEWDDAKASHEYRLDQARGLIRFVRLEFKTTRETIIAPHFVVDPDRPPRSHRYVDLTIAGQQRDRAQRILIDELDRIAAAIRRAQEIAAVLGLVDELDAMLADVQSLKTKTEKRKEAAEAKRRRKKSKSRRPRGRERPEARV
jgi:hypothetical protein